MTYTLSYTEDEKIHLTTALLVASIQWHDWRVSLALLERVDPAVAEQVRRKRGTPAEGGG